jgi:hypothetical protein
MKDWKQLLGTIAPTIATALGGPMAGFAVRTLSNALLGHENGSEADIGEAINVSGPDALLKIKQADNAFAVRLKELDIDLERIGLEDRASARERESKTGDSWTLRILAALVIVGFLACVWFVLTGQAKGLNDPAIAATIGTLIGYVSAKADQIVSYYFGSSHGSAQKTVAMNNALNKQVNK